MNGNFAFATVFVLLAVLLSVVGIFQPQLAVFMFWPVTCCLLLSAGYGGWVPNVFGKQENGSVRWSSTLVLLPYLAIYRALWHILRSLDSKPVGNRISSGLWVGRRPLADEIPANISLLVDLTSEFATPQYEGFAGKIIRLPILDGAGASPESLTQLVKNIRTHDGEVLIHCAEGHGRSVMVAVAVLLDRKTVRTIPDGVALVRQQRPKARLRPPQKASLQILGGHLSTENSER